ncbi:hypothetical protein ACS0TY_015129 [Phlomoides rotata]
MGTTISVSLVLAILYVYGANSAVFTVRNNCGFQVWPAALTGTGAKILTGFQLPPKASRNVVVPAPWSGRFWARSQCSNSGGRFSCLTGDCNSVKGPNGEVVGCKSACLALNKPQYCCTGAFGSPATCPPTKYSRIFKTKCPQAYSYAYDDKTSTFTCPSGANYVTPSVPLKASHALFFACFCLLTVS